MPFNHFTVGEPKAKKWESDFSDGQVYQPESELCVSQPFLLTHWEGGLCREGVALPGPRGGFGSQVQEQHFTLPV